MTRHGHDIDICIDCVYLLANGAPESVEPSWCPWNNGQPDSTGAVYVTAGPERSRHHLGPEYRGGYRTGGESCDGTCEDAIAAHSAAVEAAWQGYAVTLGAVDCEYCGAGAREANPTIQEDCRGWFSYSPCELCGSRLGGTREHAHASPDTLAAMFEDTKSGWMTPDALERAAVREIHRLASDLAAAEREADRERDKGEELDAALRELVDTVRLYVAAPGDYLTDLRYTVEEAEAALGNVNSDGLPPLGASPVELAAYALGVTQ